MRLILACHFVVLPLCPKIACEWALYARKLDLSTVETNEIGFTETVSYKQWKYTLIQYTMT